MPLQANGTAPYTTANAALTAITAYRDRGLGTPVTAEILVRAGVSESIANRTLNSLKALDLLDEAGEPTEQFKALRLARGQEEFESRMQEWLKEVYAEVLQYTDPSTDLPDRVAEAFRTYEPSGQRRSMAGLLVGLWKASGLSVPNDTGGSAPRRAATQRPQVRAKPPAPKSNPQAGPPKVASTPAAGTVDGATTSDTGLPPALVGLLQQIPRAGQSWTTARRDAFVAAFSAVLDYTVSVDDTPPTPAATQREEDPA